MPLLAFENNMVLVKDGRTIRMAHELDFFLSEWSHGQFTFQTNAKRCFFLLNFSGKNANFGPNVYSTCDKCSEHSMCG